MYCAWNTLVSQDSQVVGKLKKCVMLTFCLFLHVVRSALCDCVMPSCDGILSVPVPVPVAPALTLTCMSSYTV